MFIYYFINFYYNKMIKNKKESLKLFRFIFISSKFKFKRLTQPGLTRYNWSQQDFEEESHDVNIIFII